MIKEFCAENHTNIAKAIAKGANRIELCDNLAVGGTTPSYGVIKKAVKDASRHNVPLITMIRPRGGSFVYSNDDISIMKDDIEICKRLGTNGVVFGCLTNDNSIDTKVMRELIQTSAGLEIVFHMAFDLLSLEKQFNAIDWLANNGVTRILTHGGKPSTPITEHLKHLKQLVDYATGKITIMPGGGLTSDYVDQLVSTLGVTEVHGTKILG